MEYDGPERRADAFTQESKRQIEERMLRAEWTLGLHGEEITTLKNSTVTIANDLLKISTTLDKIKYIAYGAAGFYFADSFGLVPIIKGIIGL